MDLTTPERLWWLLALPVLWWLARPIRPRAIVTTPYLELWRRARERLGRRPIRIRWLRLLLLAGAFAALVLAFAGTRLSGKPGPTELFVLLDGSASMAAKEPPDGPSAYTSASRVVERTLARLPAAISCTLVVAGSELVMQRVSGTAPIEVPAWSRPAGPAPALSLAALARGAAAPGRAIWTLTDALAPAEVPELGALTLVGAPADNLAIVRAEVTDAWPLPDIAVEVSVRNASARTGRVTLAASGAATGPAAVVEIAPQALQVVTLALRRTAGGTVRILLQGQKDALPLDDAFEIRVPAPPAPDLAVLSDSDDSGALRAAARALAAECGGRVVEAGSSDRVGLLLVEGGSLPPSALVPRMITFGTRFLSEPVQPGDLLVRPQLVDWERTSPLLQGLDLSELALTRSLAAGFGGPGIDLLHGSAGPLATLRPAQGGASLHFAFTLGESNLALLPAFPSLLRRAFAACYGSSARAEVSPLAFFAAEESDLQHRPAGLAERRLPEFGSPGTSLVVPFLLLALALLVVRIYS